MNTTLTSPPGPSLKRTRIFPNAVGRSLFFVGCTVVPVFACSSENSGISSSTTGTSAGDARGDSGRDSAVDGGDSGSEDLEGGSSSEGADTDHAGCRADSFPFDVLEFRGPGANALGGLTEIIGVGDLNADGLDDFAIGRLSQYRHLVVYGRRDPSALVLTNFMEGVDGIAIRGGEIVFHGPGDVNGDGVDDLALGEPGRSVGTVEEAGRVYVAFGKSEWSSIRFGSSNTNTWDLVVDGSGDFRGTGTTLASVNDLDGDGTRELVIGAPKAGSMEHGAISIVFGGQDVEDNLIQLGAEEDAGRVDVILGQRWGERLGTTLAGLDDFNGDGRADIAVMGLPGEDPGLQTMAIVFGEDRREYQTLTHLVDLDRAQLVRTNPHPQRGHHALEHAGDFNGDGFADLVLADEERLHIIHGRTTVHEAIVIEEDTPETRIVGLETSFVGNGTYAGGFDVDADGFDDLLFGSPMANHEDAHVASSYLFSGRPAAVRAERLQLDNCELGYAMFKPEHSNFGKSVDAIGDFDGNGLIDYAVLAPAHEGDDDQYGRVYLLMAR